ncbi:conserved protein of unknown function [Candidatus Nitrospira inopinata]|jgi:glycine cleavage system aminomethyltransferase T|uniref:PilZ domain-containing protein n=2 Tax=Candidatus Nitrospira inopinata TaxID=1715989 RepID=A0A0S4KRZ7_9BACT|nr:conserved protein of unknown function [Candidatus Nitrospira inopinata]
MKRNEGKWSGAMATVNERRKFVRATLVGSALVIPHDGRRASTAVLDNVNKIGAGLHTKDRFAPKARVTVSLAFLDSNQVEQQEKLDGMIAWVKPWGKKGFLIGVVWDDVVTEEKNRWLYYYLEETLKASR